MPINHLNNLNFNRSRIKIMNRPSYFQDTVSFEGNHKAKKMIRQGIIATSLGLSIFATPVLNAQEIEPKDTIEISKNKIADIPDGIIQGGRQGVKAGDCWLLAEMNSLATTSWGKEAFKNAITKDDNGDYIVHCDGIGENYKISQEEFKEAKRRYDLSYGDADAILYELTMEKYFKEYNISRKILRNKYTPNNIDSTNIFQNNKKKAKIENSSNIKSVLKSLAKNPEKLPISYIYYYNSQNPQNINFMVFKSIQLNDKEEVESVTLFDPRYPDNLETIKYEDLISKGFVLIQGIQTNNEVNNIVHLKGVNKDYIIPPSELKSAINTSAYRAKNMHAILYELAAEKYFDENDTIRATLEDNGLAGKTSLQYLLFGIKGRETISKEAINLVLKGMGETPGKISATYIYQDKSPISDHKYHAMSVQAVQLDNKGEIESVTILDPYDPDKPKIKSYKDFISEVIVFGYVTMTPKYIQNAN